MYLGVSELELQQGALVPRQMVREVQVPPGGGQGVEG